MSRPILAWAVVDDVTGKPVTCGKCGAPLDYTEVMLYACLCWRCKRKTAESRA